MPGSIDFDSLAHQSARLQLCVLLAKRIIQCQPEDVPLAIFEVALLLDRARHPIEGLPDHVCMFNASQP